MLTPVAQHTELLGERVVVRGHRAALTARTEVLARVEAEAGERTEAADPASLVLGAVRLRGVLDHHQTVALGDLEDRVHLRRLAVEVHRHDGSGALGDRRLDGLRVHVVGGRVDVDEDGASAAVVDHRGRGHKGERHRDHLVTGLDSRCQERQVQGRRPRARRHGMTGRAELREGLLEGGDLGAEGRTGSCRGRGPGLRGARSGRSASEPGCRSGGSRVGSWGGMGWAGRRSYLHEAPAGRGRGDRSGYRRSLSRPPGGAPPRVSLARVTDPPFRRSWAARFDTYPDPIPSPPPSLLGTSREALGCGWG